MVVRERGRAGERERGVFESDTEGDRERLSVTKRQRRAFVVHTVRYDPFIKSQLPTRS